MEYHHKVSVIHRFSDRTHKEMETISGCQDNFSYNKAKNCFAIADGATQVYGQNFLLNIFVKIPILIKKIGKNGLNQFRKNG
jgi:hypothetical protein